ncbi:Creatinine amidohydrolase [Bartonella apihabitans]|nr:Creatinine amidohydrolase [Bartonella apihabitans]
MKKEDQIIAILPLGAHEYHGPHLSPTTDAVIAGAFAEHLASLFPTAPKRLTPLEVESVGYSIEHKGRPFTKTLEYSQAIDRWISIGADCYKKGIKKILVLNAHGGNSPLMNIVITELRCRFKMLAVATSWGRFGLPEGLITPENKQLDIHAGFIETSLMLYLAPEKVEMEKAQNFSNWQKNYKKNSNISGLMGHFLSAGKWRISIDWGPQEMHLPRIKRQEKRYSIMQLKVLAALLRICSLLILTNSPRKPLFQS